MRVYILTVKYHPLRGERYCMPWRRLSPSEYKVLMAVPHHLTFSEVARAARLSPSYVSARVKRLAQSLWLRFGVDYRALSLSPTYVLLRYSQLLSEYLSTVALPFVKRVARVWMRDGLKILLEATPPVGLERRFAQALPAAVEETWVEEWDVKYVPGETLLVECSGGPFEVKWELLPSSLAGDDASVGWCGYTVGKVDSLDLLILREKEAYCFASFSSISKRVKVSQQLISYHYRSHLKPVWRWNYVEVKDPEFPMVYSVEAQDRYVAAMLLGTLSKVPYLLDAFALQGDERRIVLILDIPPHELARMHASLLSTEGVRSAELVAFIDAGSMVYHGLTAHLGLRGGVWSLEALKEALEKSWDRGTQP